MDPPGDLRTASGCPATAQGRGVEPARRLRHTGSDTAESGGPARRGDWRSRSAGATWRPADVAVAVDDGAGASRLAAVSRRPDRRCCRRGAHTCTSAWRAADVAGAVDDAAGASGLGADGHGASRAERLEGGPPVVG